MTEKVHIGIFGGGGILGAHAPGFRQSQDRAEVVAVAEPDPTKAPRIRSLLGDKVAIYSDYRELLEKAEVAAVDILLPHDLHMPAAVAAAEAGKHVLIEKVMARNIWECDRMIAACGQAGVTLTVSHDRRYHPGWVTLKQVLDSGALGELYTWKLDHNQDVFPNRVGKSWIGSFDGVGGGAIMSCLTHQIDGLRWFGGEVDRVTCMTRVIPHRMEGETAGIVLAQMASGALAELSINWATRSNQPTSYRPGESGDENSLWYEMVHVCGSEGEAYFINGRGTFVMLQDRSRVQALFDVDGAVPERGFAKLKVGDGGGHPVCVSEWIKMLRGEPNAVRTSGRDCRGTVEVAEAAYRSVETGRHVDLPIDPRPWLGKTSAS